MRPLKLMEVALRRQKAVSESGLIIKPVRSRKASLSMPPPFTPSPLTPAEARTAGGGGEMNTFKVLPPDARGPPQVTEKTPITLVSSAYGLPLARLWQPRGHTRTEFRGCATGSHSAVTFTLTACMGALSGMFQIPIQDQGRHIQCVFLQTVEKNIFFF